MQNAGKSNSKIMDKKLSAQKFANQIANTSSSTTKKDEQPPPNTDSSDSDEESVSEVILGFLKNIVFEKSTARPH